MKKIWYFTDKDGYPKVFGKYENKHYPQIPCLVQTKRRDYGVRYWNVTEECWDDEECDDYYCDKDFVVKWAYLDKLINIDDDK